MDSIIFYLALVMSLLTIFNTISNVMYKKGTISHVICAIITSALWTIFYHLTH